MTRPYSEDLRERALARSEAGETIRSIGQALGIMSFGVQLWRRFGANQIAPIKRACRRSIFARPYIWRLTSFSLVI
jgi:hypothetical protein